VIALGGGGLMLQTLQSSCRTSRRQVLICADFDRSNSCRSENCIERSLQAAADRTFAS